MILKWFLLISIIVLTSCGKEILSSQNTNNDRINSTDQLQASTISLELNLDYNEKTSFSYLSNSGWATIPTSPIITSSSSDYVLTQIFFNTNNEYGSVDIYDSSSVICEYFSLKNQITNSEIDPGYTHSFNGCYYYLDGMRKELNYKPEQEIAVDQMKYLLITAHSSNPDELTQLTVDIEIDWH